MLSQSDTTTALPMNCVLARTIHCSVRPQGEQYLIYNSRTDELHLISPAAFYVLELCDGLNSVGDLVQLFSRGPSAPVQVSEWLDQFLSQLVDRGVLEVT